MGDVSNAFASPFRKINKLFIRGHIIQVFDHNVNFPIRCKARSANVASISSADLLGQLRASRSPAAFRGSSGNNSPRMATCTYASVVYDVCSALILSLGRAANSFTTYLFSRYAAPFDSDTASFDLQASIERSRLSGQLSKGGDMRWLLDVLLQAANHHVVSCRNEKPREGRSRLSPAAPVSLATCVQVSRSGDAHHGHEC